MSELEKAHTDLSVVSKLKAKVKYIEDQWKKSAFEIEGNILAQCLVIYLEAVGLDKHVVSERIEVAPDDNEEGDLESPESKPTDPAVDF